ncbi:HU family DNA-binding protein [Salicibibacter cibi]|uniref:HU family DNA-binding protein n=1 Tax=Salicibibacter cibi TaxID=2743001 RepID=A0A7T6Z8X5_9BACI|nr:HU family DNA-binding protein [Salicibibacter cibi]QQK78985.1 HU family DNA-binding protein [Salicibibacter cibi]
MNKTETIAKVAEESGVSIEDCQKVLDAFEDVLSAELSQSKDVRSAFDKVYKVLHFFKNK